MANEPAFNPNAGGRLRAAPHLSAAAQAGPGGVPERPDEFPRPGLPGRPGRPDGPSPAGPDPGPVPPTRVWLDPHAAWRDQLYERLL